METHGQGAFLSGREPGSPSHPWGQESFLSLLYLVTVFKKKQARIPVRFSLTGCLKKEHEGQKMQGLDKDEQFG